MLCGCLKDMALQIKPVSALLHAPHHVEMVHAEAAEVEK